jgi:siroheme synthase
MAKKDAEMTKQAEVVGSYEEALQAAIDHATRIHATLQAQMDNIDIRRVNWGTVGSARHIAGELSEISDQLHQEGEYSPERIAK